VSHPKRRHLQSAHPALKTSRPSKKRQLQREEGAAFLSSRPYKKGRSAIEYPVEGIEDVELGEDNSIQCMVRWKPLMVAMDNIVRRKLHRKCVLLFKEKYGSECWDKILKSKGSNLSKGA